MPISLKSVASLLTDHLQLLISKTSSASTVETDQPENPAVGTKRAWMSGSKIVLPSSDAEQYTGNILLNTVSIISRPKGMILFSYKL